MTCHLCQRPTARMVYRRTGKCCPQCADPNFIRVLDIAAPGPEVSRIAQFFGWVPPESLESLRCVITPNVRTIELRSLPVGVKPGLHWIVDGENKLPDRVIIPRGTEIIESFTVKDGVRVVTSTFIRGLGLVDGPLPAPNHLGDIELVMTNKPPLP